MNLKDIPLKTLDCICTRGETTVGSIIRFFTHDRVNKDVTALGTPISNHCGLIIFLGDVPMVMEMLGTGLELNPLADYFQTHKDRIVTVKRLPFNDPDIISAKKFMFSVYWTDNTKYSYSELLKFPNFCKILGLSKIVSPKMYCSEFCEIIANKYNLSWVKDTSVASGIAPIDIQFGQGETIWRENIA